MFRYVALFLYFVKYIGNVLQASLINEIKIDILNKMECVLITKNKYCQGIYNGGYICCLESFRSR